MALVRDTWNIKSPPNPSNFTIPTEMWYLIRNSRNQILHKAMENSKDNRNSKVKECNSAISSMNDDGLGIWNTIVKDQLLVCEGKIKFYKGLPTLPSEIHRKLLSQR